MDEPGCPWIPSPHFNTGPTTKRYVILHGTGYDANQTAAGIANDFATSNPNSVHYAVDRSGGWAQMVRESDIAWGNGIIQAGPNHGAWWSGDPNTYTISIETSNDNQNSLVLSAAQQATLFRLVRDICGRHAIPMRPADASGGITGHYSIESVDRAYCPGPNFPWAALWSALGHGIPAGWKDDGTTLTAPNGIPVVRGFRDYVLANPWDASDWPLGPEAWRSPAMDGAPQDGAGSRQLFRYTDMVWTPTLGVILAWVAAELAFDEARIAKLNATPPPPYPDMRPALAALTARFDQLQTDVQTALTDAGGQV